MLQVGRRGPVGSADDERAVLSLSVEGEPDIGRPTGDRATAAPSVPSERTDLVDLAGATITDEDPAQPACPSLGTVWRKLVPGRSGKRLVKVTGSRVSTLTVFSGEPPDRRQRARLRRPRGPRVAADGGAGAPPHAAVDPARHGALAGRRAGRAHRHRRLAGDRDRRRAGRLRPDVGRAGRRLPGGVPALPRREGARQRAAPARPARARSTASRGSRSSSSCAARRCAMRRSASSARTGASTPRGGRCG